MRSGLHKGILVSVFGVLGMIAAVTVLNFTLLSVQWTYEPCPIREDFPVPPGAVMELKDGGDRITYTWNKMEPGGVTIPDAYLEEIAAWGWEASGTPPGSVPTGTRFVKGDAEIDILIPNTMHQKNGGFIIEIPSPGAGE